MDTHYGADFTQAEPDIRLLGNEGETGDGRLWACPPVPAPCKLQHNNSHIFIWIGFITCMCLEQESGEKIAVKLCRLDLNSKNKDRWSREIQIMKK